MAKPFLKWAGGKAKLVPQILSHFPENWNVKTDFYVEPFLGGGAVFFALEPSNAILHDINERLIETCRSVRDFPAGVIERLSAFESRHKLEGERFFRSVRSDLNSPDPCLGAIDSAAGFIFINKAGFNGLYRVNRDNEINVPWGKDPNRIVCQPDLIRDCSRVLKSAYMFNYSFEKLDFSLIPRKRKAVIYCDPPYSPVTKTSNFTGYTAGGFDNLDHFALAAIANSWTERATVILSQSADESLINVYLNYGFQCEKILARRNINSKGVARGPIDEYILWKECNT